MRVVYMRITESLSTAAMTVSKNGSFGSFVVLAETRS